MLKFLDKYWPFISILLILTTVGAALLWPGIAQTLALAILFATVGLVIAFSIQGRIRAYRAGRLDRAGLLRYILLDVLEILVTLGVAIVAGRAAGNAAEQAAAGKGVPVIVVAGLAAGIAAGLAAGFAVRWAWRKAMHPDRIT